MVQASRSLWYEQVLEPRITAYVIGDLMVRYGPMWAFQKFFPALSIQGSKSVKEVNF